MICTVCGNTEGNNEYCEYCRHNLKSDIINSSFLAKSINATQKNFAENYSAEILEQRTRIKKDVTKIPYLCW